MANPFIGVRIPPDLEEALIARMRETGQSKSDIVINALRSYLGIKSCHDKLDDLERRLSALEELTKGADALRVEYGSHPASHTTDSNADHF